MHATEQLKKVTPRDKKLFDRAFGSLEIPLAEHSFSWILLWDGCYTDIEWGEINGNLCLFLTFEGNRHVWGPVFPGRKLQETVKKCFELCRKYNKKKGIKKQPDMMYIPEELRESYSSIEGFELKSQFNDYLYLTKDIIGLSGKKYSDKRNKRNFFMKKYSYLTENYNAPKHLCGCIELLEEWKKQKEILVSDDDREKFEADIEANRKVMEHAADLGIKGMVVLVSGKIEGYIFGEQTNERICTLFFGKTSLEIKGLSQFIYGEFLQKSFGGCELVNDGEDWGVSYLKKSKSSYNPHMIRKSYTLVKNGRI